MMFVRSLLCSLCVFVCPLGVEAAETTQSQALFFVLQTNEMLVEISTAKLLQVTDMTYMIPRLLPIIECFGACAAQIDENDAKAVWKLCAAGMCRLRLEDALKRIQLRFDEQITKYPAFLEKLSVFITKWSELLKEYKACKPTDVIDFLHMSAPDWVKGCYGSANEEHRRILSEYFGFKLLLNNFFQLVLQRCEYAKLCLEKIAKAQQPKEVQEVVDMIARLSNIDLSIKEVDEKYYLEYTEKREKEFDFSASLGIDYNAQIHARLAQAVEQARVVDLTQTEEPLKEIAMLVQKIFHEYLRLQTGSSGGRGEGSW